MPTISNSPTPDHPFRPKGVAAISIYYFGSAVTLVRLLLLLTRKDLDRFSQAEALCISPVLIALSIGLWKMKNWARVSAALLTAAGLVASVVSKIFYGFPYGLDSWTFALTITLSLLSFGLNFWILTYLMSSRVRRAFLSPSLFL